MQVKHVFLGFMYDFNEVAIAQIIPVKTNTYFLTRSIGKIFTVKQFYQVLKHIFH